MCSLVKMQGICGTAGCASGNLGACRSRVSWNLLVVGDIAYAKSGETQIAYRVIGEAGRVDVIMVAGALFPFELLAEDRVASRFHRRSRGAGSCPGVRQARGGTVRSADRLVSQRAGAVGRGPA